MKLFSNLIISKLFIQIYFFVIVQKVLEKNKVVILAWVSFIFVS